MNHVLPPSGSGNSAPLDIFSSPVRESSREAASGAPEAPKTEFSGPQKTLSATIGAETVGLIQTVDQTTATQVAGQIQYHNSIMTNDGGAPAKSQPNPDGLATINNGIADLAGAKLI